MTGAAGRADVAQSDPVPTLGGPTPGGAPARPGLELLLVLGVSLGMDGVNAVVTLAYQLTQAPLNQQTQTLNPTQSDVQVFDLIEQLLQIAWPLVPVLLALYLLGRGATHAIGLDLRRPGRDAGTGVLLALVIGIPGLALYLVAEHLGADVRIDASGLNATWYAIPVLILSAVRAALQEEVIVVGYLVRRLDDLRWKPWAVLVASAVLRGSYHLYQGFGGFVGNAVMGVVFVLVYRRWGRTTPLVVAHALLDVRRLRRRPRDRPAPAAVSVARPTRRKRGVPSGRGPEHRAAARRRDGGGAPHRVDGPGRGGPAEPRDA